MPAACAQVLLEVWARSGGPGGSIGAGAGSGAEGMSSSRVGGNGGSSGVGNGGGQGSIAAGGSGTSSGRQGVMLSPELQERLEKLLELDKQVDEMWQVHYILD